MSDFNLRHRIAPAELSGQKPEAVVHGQWRPIETVPRDETVILANFTEACLLTGAPHVWTATYVTEWADLKTGKSVERPPRWNECSHAATNENGEPTHWMPLPEPPQAAPCSRSDRSDLKKPCSTCNGTRVVADGEIYRIHYVGGAKLFSGPIQRIKDCPACMGARSDDQDDPTAQSKKDHP